MKSDENEDVEVFFVPIGKARKRHEVVTTSFTGDVICLKCRKTFRSFDRRFQKICRNCELQNLNTREPDPVKIDF